MGKFTVLWAKARDFWNVEYDENGNGHYTGIKNYYNITDKEELHQKDLLLFMGRGESAVKIKGNHDLEHFAKMHYYLFKDLYPWAGKCRDYSVIKKESCLSGETVDYCNPEFIINSFNLYVEPLKNPMLKNKSITEKTQIIADSYQGLWQTHCFPEGNTRTTMLFVAKTLKDNGIKLDLKYLMSEHEIMRKALSFYSTEQSNLKAPFEQIIYNALSKEKDRERVLIPDKIEKNPKTGHFNIVQNRLERNDELER